MATVKALVKKELLTWARESAGYSISAAAKKAGVKDATLEAWETTDEKPTIAQLRRLGEIYRRPIAVFYLAEPPRDFQPMGDFRRRGEEVPISPELRQEINLAQQRREVGLELLEALGETAPSMPASQKASLTEQTEEVGTRIRNFLEIKFSEQITWRDKYKPFKNWRQALERKGVLVFQITDVDSDEIAGFSLAYPELPVISVNIKDGPRARTFTLLHEFAHLLLRQNSICNALAWEGDRQQDVERVEVFCNYVAGASLIPQALLLNEDLVRNHEGHEWEDRDIEELAYRRYGTSRETLLRRLLIFGKTTKEFYALKREQYRREYLRERERSAQAEDEHNFLPPAQKAVISEGKPFIDLVLRNFYENKITISDVSSLLGVRLKHLPKIEAEVMGRVISRVDVS